jgi:hypothetical protein
MPRNAVLVIALLTGPALLFPRTGHGEPADAVPPAVSAPPTTEAPADERRSVVPQAATALTKDAADMSLPVFEPGMWEYRRTLTVTAHGIPQTASVKKCSDPSKDIRQKLEGLKQKGCRFSSTTHTRERYHLSWVCPTKGGLFALSDVITVKGAGGYEDVTESHYEQRTTRSFIVATRVGPCPLLPGARKPHRAP